MERTRRRTFQAGIMLLLMGCAVGAHGSDVSADRAAQRALDLDAHPERGRLLFTRHCQQCHLAQGHGDAAHAVPALAGQRITYLIRQLADFAGDQRDSTVMHRAVSGRELGNPQAWADLAGYLARVPVGTGLETGNGAHVALGGAIFHEQCAACHAADARGDAEGVVPSLRNQNYAYLLDQLRRLGAGSRHNVDEDLMRFLHSFSDDDRRATADYLSRLT